MRMRDRVRTSLRPYRLMAPMLALFVLPLAARAQQQSQVFIVQTERQTDLPFHPTHVPLDRHKLSPRGRNALLMAFIAEQGFARRAMPLDSHGLVLHANGPLTPSGLDYDRLLQSKGISSEPGDRLVISDLRIESNKIVFLFNGGPDRKHRFLRHVQLGAGMATVPLAPDDGKEPVGSRFTLVFDRNVPEMTADQLRALIQPVIDFSAKTPMEAYADTLPPVIRDAILHHQVLVGMSRKMVMYAVGSPGRKSRETDASGNPFEDWIYGEAPETMQFVRFVGDRVVRIEVANVGEDLVVRNHDETGGYQPVDHSHEVPMGDVARTTDGQDSRQKPPTLRLPGEDLPGSTQPVNLPGASQPVTAPQPVPAGPTPPVPQMAPGQSP